MPEITGETPQHSTIPEWMNMTKENIMAGVQQLKEEAAEKAREAAILIGGSVPIELIGGGAFLYGTIKNENFVIAAGGLGLAIGTGLLVEGIRKGGQYLDLNSQINEREIVVASRVLAENDKK